MTAVVTLGVAALCILLLKCLCCCFEYIWTTIQTESTEHQDLIVLRDQPPPASAPDPPPSYNPRFNGDTNSAKVHYPLRPFAGDDSPPSYDEVTRYESIVNLS